jgi:RHS repeat-associated protein
VGLPDGEQSVGLLRRSFTNGRISFSKTYEFTSKERDDESNYDYFGARYYDARIANWISVDPLFAKHLQFSGYNYALRNPLKYIDPDGMQVKFDKAFMNTQGFKTLLNELRLYSGMALTVNNEGFLGIGLWHGYPIVGKGSPTIQKMVKTMLMATKWSATIGSNANYNSYGKSTSSGTEVNLNAEQINKFISGASGVDNRTMGWAMTLLHEGYTQDMEWAIHIPMI